MSAPPPKIHVRGFTTRFDRLSNVLINKVHIAPAFSTPTIPIDACLTEFVAIWDTGATNSVVTKAVAGACGLKAIGMASVNHANGGCIVPRYMVSLFLPNKAVIPAVVVSEMALTGADVLIGMDVISQGDFIVSNKGRKTSFSFRMPSVGIEFQQQQHLSGPITNPPVSRRAPCPCGSGEKYKNCCEKKVFSSFPGK